MLRSSVQRKCQRHFPGGCFISKPSCIILIMCVRKTKSGIQWFELNKRKKKGGGGRPQTSLAYSTESLLYVYGYSFCHLLD